MTRPTSLPSGTTAESLAASIAGAHHPEYTPEQAQRAAEVIARLADVKQEANRAMTRPTNRDELARHLHIHAHDAEGAGDRWQVLGAQEWDQNLVTDDDVALAYAEADQILVGQVA